MRLFDWYSSGDTD
jgi:dihydrofolate reductase